MSIRSLHLGLTKLTIFVFTVIFVKLVDERVYSRNAPVGRVCGALCSAVLHTYVLHCYHYKCVGGVCT